MGEIEITIAGTTNSGKTFLREYLQKYLEGVGARVVHNDPDIHTKEQYEEIKKNIVFENPIKINVVQAKQKKI